MDRYGNNPIEWFTFEPGYMFHTINAWEEEENGEEVIVLLGCRSNEMNLDFSINALSSYPHCFRINLTTKKISENDISKVACEFPVIHPNLLGRPCKYAYSATIATNKIEPLFDGIVKFDLTQKTTDGEMKASTIGQYKYGPNRFGGEAVFVPKKMVLVRMMVTY